jgi:hypothetical protein
MYVRGERPSTFKAVLWARIQLVHSLACISLRHAHSRQHRLKLSINMSFEGGKWAQTHS